MQVANEGQRRRSRRKVRFARADMTVAEEKKRKGNETDSEPGLWRIAEGLGHDKSPTRRSIAGRHGAVSRSSGSRIKRRQHRSLTYSKCSRPRQEVDKLTLTMRRNFGEALIAVGCNTVLNSRVGLLHSSAARCRIRGVTGSMHCHERERPRRSGTSSSSTDLKRWWLTNLESHLNAISSVTKSCTGVGAPNLLPFSDMAASLDALRCTSAHKSEADAAVKRFPRTERCHGGFDGEGSLLS